MIKIYNKKSIKEIREERELQAKLEELLKTLEDDKKEDKEKEPGK